MMNLDWPKFSAYQMRAMQNEPAVGPKPVGGNPRIMQFSQPSYGQGVGGAQMPPPVNTMQGPVRPYAAPIGPNQPYSAPIGPRAPYAAPIGPNMPYEAPIGPMAQSGAMRDLQAVARPISKVGSALGTFGSYLAPVVNNPLTRTVARVAGPVGAAIGGYSATNELLDPNSDPRQRFAAAGADAAKGNFGSAAKNAYYGVGDVVGTVTGAKPFAQYLSGRSGAAPISYDAKSQSFSRAPTTKAEYDEMMAAKAAAMPTAAMASPTDPAIQAAYGNAAPRATAQSYNDWLMKQPVSKLNATDYANRAQMEIDKRAPELAQQNFLKAAAYNMNHPDMVTGEQHHKDGSWSKTYGDRGAHAMQAYGTFRDAMARNDVEGVKAQAAMERAQNSEKFTKADTVNMISAAQQRVMGALFGDESVPTEIKLQQARAYFPTYAAALKQNGIEPPDFDTWLESQYGVTKGAGGFYSKPK